MTKEKNSQINYIDEKILREICHEIACRLFQEKEPMGLYEDHDQGKLESSLNLPQQAVYGQELYPGLFKKAAITFYALNRNHIFGNGNKRLSVASVIIFLFLNDRILMVSQGEMRDKAIWLAKVQDPIGVVVNQLSVWLEEKSVTVKEYEVFLETKAKEGK